MVFPSPEKPLRGLLQSEIQDIIYTCADRIPLRRPGVLHQMWSSPVGPADFRAVLICIDGKVKNFDGHMLRLGVHFNLNYAQLEEDLQLTVLPDAYERDGDMPYDQTIGLQAYVTAHLRWLAHRWHETPQTQLRLPKDEAGHTHCTPFCL